LEISEPKVKLLTTEANGYWFVFIHSLIFAWCESKKVLMKQIEKFEAILNQIADGVFVIDKNWRIELFNAAVETITGFSAKEAIGKRCREILRSDVCDYDCVVRRVLDTGKPVINYEIQIIRKDGIRVPVSESASLLQDEEFNRTFYPTV